jgi:hypothetical protein
MFELDIESIGQVIATFLIVGFFLVSLYRKRVKITKKKNDGDNDYLHWL